MSSFIIKKESNVYNFKLEDWLNKNLAKESKTENKRPSKDGNIDLSDQFNHIK